MTSRSDFCFRGPVKLPVSGQITCRFTVLRVSPDFVFIGDDTNLFPGSRSVTNSAEEVVAWCIKHYGNRRIVYMDTCGRWDELAHDGSKFTDFKPVPSCFSLAGVH